LAELHQTLVEAVVERDPERAARTMSLQLQPLVDTLDGDDQARRPP